MVKQKKQPAVRKLEFVDFNAASIVLGNLEMIYADLIDDGGIQYKMLLNDMVAESKSLAV